MVLESRAQLHHISLWALRMWPHHLHFSLQGCKLGITMVMVCLKFIVGLPGVLNVDMSVISDVTSPGNQKEQCESPSLTDTLYL